MREQEAKKAHSEFWMGISFLLLIYLIYHQGTETKVLIKNIKAHNLDTVSVGDSVYVLKVKVDTQYYESQEHEPPDNN